MPALITPFRRDGTLDRGAHRHNLQTLATRGIRGFLVAGTTGESVFLEPGEREALAAATREATPSAFVVVGVNAPTTRLARSQMREAEAGGADALLVSSPTALLRGRHHLVQRFLEEVADSSPLPIFLYSFPQETGYEPPLDLVAALAAHPRVVGMKDSGGHPVRMADLAACTPDGFLLYAGASAAISLSVAAVASGTMAASANHLPELVTGVVKRARRSPRSAAPLQTALTTAARAIEQFGIPGTKAAAQLSGLQPGSDRPPLQPLRRSELQVVERAWRTAATAPTSE